MHLPTFYKQEERHGLKQLSETVIKKQSPNFFFFWKSRKEYCQSTLDPRTLYNKILLILTLYNINMFSEGTNANCGLVLLTGNHNVWSQSELFCHKEIVESFDQPRPKSWTTYTFPENINQKRALKISPVMKAITHCGSSLHKVDSEQLYLQKPPLKFLMS